jgi:hypothetical protein
MGLLDDAIREHLELKRLRGADPSEVARDERAALGPPVREELEEHDSAKPDFAEPLQESGDYVKEDSSVEGADRTAGETDMSEAGDIPRSGEETMEVDMRTIIDADLGHDDAELNGEAMAANTAAYGVGSSGMSRERRDASRSADWEAREQRRWPGRALGLGRGPSTEGSLP